MLYYTNGDKNNHHIHNIQSEKNSISIKWFLLRQNNHSYWRELQGLNSFTAAVIEKHCFSEQ